MLLCVQHSECDSFTTFNSCIGFCRYTLIRILIPATTQKKDETMRWEAAKDMKKCCRMLKNTRLEDNVAQFATTGNLGEFNVSIQRVRESGGKCSLNVRDQGSLRQLSIKDWRDPMKQMARVTCTPVKVPLMLENNICCLMTFWGTSPLLQGATVCLPASVASE